MEEEPASVVRAAQRLDEGAPRSEALANELAAARRELEEAVQRTHTAEAALEELQKSLQQEQTRGVQLANDLAAARGEIDNRIAQSRKADDAAAQQRDAAAGEIAELQQSLQHERQRNTVLVRQANAAQAAAESAEEQRRETQSRAAALASELAGRPRRSEAAAADQSEAAEREIAELRQSLQDARQKNAELVAEAKAAQVAAANAERQRHALEEAHAYAASLAQELTEARRKAETWNERLREASDEASQQKEATNRELVELRQTLQRERIEARERALASAWSLASVRLLMEQTSLGPISPRPQPMDATAAEPLPSANQIEAEARLIPRAKALLDQGNIGAARIVLELAAEKDVAQASFMLAETYDPAVLSAWGTYGTRGEEAKARELYAKAQRGGIREAKERLDALHR
ncbi:chromosome segregation ATPase [Bradyrhizobium daqingense]